MNSTQRLLAIVLVGAVALALVQLLAHDRLRADGRLTTSDGDTVDISGAARAASLRFGADVAPADRDWILAAIARARPEAARLIGEVDGLVQVGTAVIDFALGPAAVNEALDAQIPRGGPCGPVIDCDRAEERFADTFAKWALNGAVSQVGAGYGIAMPASLEGWGVPPAPPSFRLPGCAGQPRG